MKTRQLLIHNQPGATKRAWIRETHLAPFRRRVGNASAWKPVQSQPPLSGRDTLFMAGMLVGSATAFTLSAYRFDEARQGLDKAMATERQDPPTLKQIRLENDRLDYGGTLLLSALAIAAFGQMVYKSLKARFGY